MSRIPPGHAAVPHCGARFLKSGPGLFRSSFPVRPRPPLRRRFLRLVVLQRGPPRDGPTTPVSVCLDRGPKNLVHLSHNPFAGIQCPSRSLLVGLPCLRLRQGIAAQVSFPHVGTERALCCGASLVFETRHDNQVSLPPNNSLSLPPSALPLRQSVLRTILCFFASLHQVTIPADAHPRARMRFSFQVCHTSSSFQSLFLHGSLVGPSRGSVNPPGRVGHSCLITCLATPFGLSSCPFFPPQCHGHSSLALGNASGVQWVLSWVKVRSPLIIFESRQHLCDPPSAGPQPLPSHLVDPAPPANITQTNSVAKAQIASPLMSCVQLHIRHGHQAQGAHLRVVMGLRYLAHRTTASNQAQVPSHNAPPEHLDQSPSAKCSHPRSNSAPASARMILPTRSLELATVRGTPSLSRCPFSPSFLLETPHAERGWLPPLFFRANVQVAISPNPLGGVQGPSFHAKTLCDGEGHCRLEKVLDLGPFIEETTPGLPVMYIAVLEGWFPATPSQLEVFNRLLLGQDPEPYPLPYRWVRGNLVSSPQPVQPAVPSSPFHLCFFHLTWFRHSGLASPGAVSHSIIPLYSGNLLCRYLASVPRRPPFTAHHRRLPVLCRRAPRPPTAQNAR